MRRCPRCNATAIIDYDDAPGSRQRVWKCIGCGREVLADAQDQAEDERLLQGIREAIASAGVPKRSRRV